MESGQRSADDHQDRIDRLVLEAVQRNMEMAEISRNRIDVFGVPDTDASPFTREIRDYLLPERFVLPKFDNYDGVSDPTAHLRHFAQKVSLWGDDGRLSCRISSSLGDIALRWYCGLSPESISSWNQLQTSFLAKFLPYRVIPKKDNDLSTLRMR